MGLKFPSDLDAWRRWQNEQRRIRRARHALLRKAEESPILFGIGGANPDVLVALDSHARSGVLAVMEPARYIDPRRVAFLALPEPWVRLQATESGLHEWVPLQDQFSNPGLRVVLAQGHYAPSGSAAYAIARRRGIPFVVVQHGLLTPFAPPLPANSFLMAWTEQDAAYWAGGRTDVEIRVTGSQLLHRAASEIVAVSERANRPIGYLGQLHGVELPWRQLLLSAVSACRGENLVYRAHPYELDLRSKLSHQVLRRCGVEFDQQGHDLLRDYSGVVGVFSTGLLEAAASGIPAWGHMLRPPAWIEELWDRYEIPRLGEPANVRGAIAGTAPAERIAEQLLALA